MNVARYRHTATRLPNGKTLIAGGQNKDSFNNTAELYDAAEGNFEYAKGLMTSRGIRIRRRSEQRESIAGGRH